MIKIYNHVILKIISGQLLPTHTYRINLYTTLPFWFAALSLQDATRDSVESSGGDYVSNQKPVVISAGPSGSKGAAWFANDVTWLEPGNMQVRYGLIYQATNQWPVAHLDFGRLYTNHNEPFRISFDNQGLIHFNLYS